MSNDSRKNTELTCECRAEEIVFLPCAGGSNCGQITNRVAVKLDEEGVGHIYCLAGIGAHIGGMVELARAAKRIVALDGCNVGGWHRYQRQQTQSTEHGYGEERR